MGVWQGPLETVVSRPSKMPSPAFWQGRSVLVTGHTGFKGAWLCQWLLEMGAKVHGYALDPVARPNLFDALALTDSLATDVRANLSDLERLRATLEFAQPSVVIHMAAQSLVRESYRQPIATVATNVLGTAHVLEAARACASILAILVITTDKVYENREWVHPYREGDALGGHDLYSASKAAAELIVSAYRRSFYDTREADLHLPVLCTARAGNVIGGGDWSVDRLVPDCVRAFSTGQAVTLRQPDALRPWQHVLDPLSGYLVLLEHMCGSRGEPGTTAWNFGPDGAGDGTVGVVAQEIARLWGDNARVVIDSGAAKGMHEAGLLRLDPSLAKARLGWRCRWGLNRALKETVHWYRAFAATGNAKELCRAQLQAFIHGDPS